MSDEPDKKLFEQAIRANPYDAVTRKIFSDWLEEHGYDDEAALQRSWTPEKQQAEDWLTTYAQEYYLTYPDLLSAAHAFLDAGTTSCQGVDVAAALFDPARWEDFWQQFALVTGRNLDGAAGPFASVLIMRILMTAIRAACAPGSGKAMRTSRTIHLTMISTTSADGDVPTSCRFAKIMSDRLRLSARVVRDERSAASGGEIP